MTIPGRPEYIQTAKLAVGSIASIGGFDYDSLEDIRIAVGEACKCITCHNYDCWSKDYEVSAVLDERGLRIHIEDDCEAHDVPKSGHICLDCPKEGELAVNIISSIMDDFQVEKDGSCARSITMVKYLTERPEETPDRK